MYTQGRSGEVLGAVVFSWSWDMSAEKNLKYLRGLLSVDVWPATGTSTLVIIVSGDHGGDLAINKSSPEVSGSEAPDSLALVVLAVWACLSYVAGPVLLDSYDPRWPTAIFSANSLPSNILCTDMLCGSQVQGTRISLCKSATLVSYAKANSIVFSTPCYQQTIHPTGAACQNIMNHSSPTCRIILTEVLLIAIIIVRPGSGWSLTQAIILGNFDSRCGPEPFIADFLLAKATFHRSRLSIIGHEEPRYYPCL